MPAGTVIFTTRARRRRQSVVALGVALAGVLLLVALAALAGLVFAGSGSTLAPGTKIAGVDVGGLTPREAESRLRARERAVALTPVAFVAAGREFRFTASQLGVEADWRAAVAAARRAGDGFWPIRAFRRLRIRFFGGEVTPRVGAYPSAVRAAVARIAAAVDEKQIDASLVRHALRVEIVPGRAGRSLDRAAAASAVARALGALQHPTRVTLAVREAPQRVTAAALARPARQARLVLSAPVRLRYDGTVWRLPRWRLAGLLELPAAGSTRLAIGGPDAQSYFRQLAARVGRKPVDATFRLLAGNRIGIVPSKPGLALDVGATSRAALAAALLPGNRSARLVVRVARPRRTTADARGMGITSVVSSFSTTYGGTPGRLHNVALVSRLIDGALIAPGETFSFNRTTGARTAAKGFEIAPVIINGELQNALGGGVCQVSTTTFNAAFFAGLPIVARTNHALYISHYPLGRDATVNYPDVDLRFRNDTKKWLLLRTFVGPGSLTVTLYGTPRHRRIEYETAPLAAVGAMPVTRIKDPTLKKGEQVVEQSGAPPTVTTVRRRVYDASGKLLQDTTWHSTYVAEPEIVRVGTKKPQPKPAADIAASLASAFAGGATPSAGPAPAR